MTTMIITHKQTTSHNSTLDHHLNTQRKDKQDKHEKTKLQNTVAAAETTTTTKGCKLYIYPLAYKST